MSDVDPKRLMRLLPTLERRKDEGPWPTKELLLYALAWPMSDYWQTLALFWIDTVPRDDDVRASLLTLTKTGSTQKLRHAAMRALRQPVRTP